MASPYSTKLIALVNFRPSNLMIFPSFQRQRHFTARARPFGDGTHPFGYSSIESCSLSFRLSRRWSPSSASRLPFWRWLHNHRIDQLHRALGELKHELTQDADKSRFADYRTRLAEVEFAVRSLKVARSFEVNLDGLCIHLRMVRRN